MKTSVTVLVIEDDQWLSAQFQRLLNRAKFVVHTVNNALDGMAAIDTHKPDVIILDIFMPGPNGIVLLHEIRSHSDLVRVPIIICSNSASDVPHGDLSAYGVRTVLDKTTMQPDDIVAAVKRVLL
ncbi:MAG: response regulator [Candidatus Saccharimonas sp.]